MWQALRETIRPKGAELITVGMDTLGAAGCAPAIQAANAAHPSLIDTHHQMASLFGVVNIPQAIWINEEGMIVRPAESAPPPPAPASEEAPAPEGLDALPARMQAIMVEASQIQSDPAAYHHALMDWVEQGEASEFALSEAAVIERSKPQSDDRARGHAHFELASEAATLGHKGLAVKHFRAAHALVPDSWTFRRQAWSLEPVDAAGPFARFWQGPHPDRPEERPYEGDWLSDIRAEGPANYYDPFSGK